MSSKKGGVIASLGASPQTRKGLFYGVCVILRTFLAVAVAVWGGSDQYEVPLAITLAVVLGIGALVNLSKNTKVWWTRKIHGALLGSAAISSIISAVLPGRGVYLVVSGILLSDVVYGFTNSLLLKPFD